MDVADAAAWDDQAAAGFSVSYHRVQNDVGGMIGVVSTVTQTSPRGVRGIVAS